MPPEQDSEHKNVTVRHILFVVVAIVIISLVVWYFKPQIPYLTKRTLPTPSAEEEKKYNILNNLIKTNATLTTKESKLKILEELEKQKTSVTFSEWEALSELEKRKTSIILSDNDKMKLLESLR